MLDRKTSTTPRIIEVDAHSHIRILATSVTEIIRRLSLIRLQHSTNWHRMVCV